MFRPQPGSVRADFQPALNKEYLKIDLFSLKSARACTHPVSPFLRWLSAPHILMAEYPESKFPFFVILSGGNSEFMVLGTRERECYLYSSLAQCPYRDETFTISYPCLKTSCRHIIIFLLTPSILLPSLSSTDPDALSL